jgi:dTDP-4-amino-4,6-dideoxygalactose transaminase
VRAIGLEGGDEVLVPAYHHGSEVEALLRAGLTCRFYDATETLAPDEDELESLLGPRVRGLQLTHYLGFAQDAARWRKWCDERQLLLIEDAAQAWLASEDGGPVGSVGDLAIFCFYKTVGVPDGGALITRTPPAAHRARRRIGARPLTRRHAAWLAGRWRHLGGVASGRRERPFDAAEDVALGDPHSAPAVATSFLLPRLVDADIAARRRAHYQLLLDELGASVPEPFRRLRDGAAPLACPLEADDKPALLERLRDSNVQALDFWSVPHPALPVDRFPAAAARRARTVALPVHQELRPADLERVVGSVVGGRRRARLRTERVGELEALAEEWTALAAESKNVFSTCEWASIWWRHFGRGRLLASTCRADDGTLLAVLPLYAAAQGPVSVVRFVGHGPADELGPVCAPANRAAAARALRETLRGERWDVLLGELLPRDAAWSGLIGGRTLRRSASPVLRVDGATWDQVLAERSANFRSQVRRRERKLAREHELRFRLADDRDQLSADLDVLFGLHAARWRNERSGFTGRTEAFHREFAECAFDRGWLRLWFLELDGKTAAVWYGFRFAGVESYYQAGRDPSWDASSVGFVLLAHSIREAIADGVQEYRFLRGGESFKYRFANADPGLETIGLAHGPIGGAALAAAAALRGPLRAALRQ